MAGSWRAAYIGAALWAAAVLVLMLLGANLWIVAQSAPLIYTEREAVPSRTVAIVLGAAVTPADGEVRLTTALADRYRIEREPGAGGMARPRGLRT